MNAAASTKNGGFRVSWTVLISTGSLVLALVSGGWALIQSEINSVRREMTDLKELTASERAALGHRLENDEKDTAALRDSKVDYNRFNTAGNNIRSELAAMRSSAAADREDIRKHTDAIGTVVDGLRSTKLDITRFDQLLSKVLSSGEVEARDIALQKQIDALAGRLNKLEKNHTPHR